MATGTSETPDSLPQLQRVEHYEIAWYGTARTLATRLGESEAADKLQATLDEEGVRDWLEKTAEEFYKQRFKVKKHARSNQDDLTAQAQGVSRKLHR